MNLPGLVGVACALGMASSGCLGARQTSEDADRPVDGTPEWFIEGRELERANGVYPTCHPSYMAGCYLGEATYTEGTFPGARRFIVNTTNTNQSVHVRIFFSEPLYGGTELLVQGYEPDCDDVSQVLYRDIDVFEEAGDDNTIVAELDTQTPGEHLIEIFSDCASDFLLTAD